MNRFFRMIYCVALTALTFTAVSCSDDDDDNVTPPATPKPSEVLTAGIPTQIGDAMITKNAAGQVTAINIREADGDVTNLEFDYTPVSRANYDMTMTVDWGDPGEKATFYIQLNERGFIAYAREFETDEPGYEEWWFKYNTDGTMSEMKRSEGDNEVTTITYQNGDIVRVEEAGDDTLPGEKDAVVISYTNAANPTMIDNKGCIMLYDDTFGIDMDEMWYAYYAGLLGMPTRHLPVQMDGENIVYNEYTNSFDTYTETEYFTWTLDGNGLPIKLVCDDPSSGYGQHEIVMKWP